MKIFKRLSFFVFLLSIFACDVPKEKIKQKKPNIILIIADDMNWDDSGAYGHPTIRTPNIDQMAKDGMRFDRTYLTTSSCSPSRSSIITGQYPHNTGAEQLHWGLAAGKITFVQQLKASGYYTAAAGKWHLGNNIRNHFDSIHEASVSGFQLPTGNGKNPPKMVAKKPSGCEDWVSTLQSRPKGKPFFLWLAALDPHRAYEPGTLTPPHELSDVIVPPYMPDVPKVREDLRMYYDEIGRLDQFVGKVVNELEIQGIVDNTIIIFMSDNGRPFPRDKTTLYEGGIKTPFIVKWPKKVQPGSVTKSLVSSIDIAPTIAEIAGIRKSKTFEGVSFLSILENPKNTTRKFAFGEDHWHDYEDHGRSIVGDQWKLIRNDYEDLAATPSADAGRSFTWQAMLKLKAEDKLNSAQLSCFIAPRPRYELYDLDNDPNELYNLAKEEKHQQKLKNLIEGLNTWAEQTNDFLPSIRTPDEFGRIAGEPIHSVRKRPRPDKKEMFGTYGTY